MKYVLTLGVVLFAMVTASQVLAGDKNCNAKADRPTKSVAWDPFALGVKPSAYRLWDQKLCRYKTVIDGRATVGNSRAQMTKSQFRACIKLTKDGKSPARKKISYIKTEEEKQRLVDLLGLAKSTDSTTGAVMNSVANTGVGMLLGEIPGSSFVQGGVDIAKAIVENSCGAQKIKKQKGSLKTLLIDLGAGRGARLYYEMNLTRSVNARGESLLQEVVSFQIWMGDSTDKVGTMVVIPLRYSDILVKLVD